MTLPLHDYPGNSQIDTLMSFWGACGGVEEDEVVKKESSCERILSYLYGIVECCGIYKSI